jgi:hypothetical protein
MDMYMNGPITCKGFSHVKEAARLRQRIGYHGYHETYGLGYCDIDAWYKHLCEDGMPLCLGQETRALGMVSHRSVARL